ncbi:MAG: hypothetical protein WDN28_32315 [Chthoniobacter sp.]
MNRRWNTTVSPRLNQSSGSLLAANVPLLKETRRDSRSIYTSASLSCAWLAASMPMVKSTGALTPLALPARSENS